MDKDNPACYECPKGKNKLHTWKRLTMGGAWCQKCNLFICEEHAKQVFEDHG